MEQKIMVKTLSVSGMVCPSCEMRIKNKLKKMPGVIKVNAAYADDTVKITFDPARLTLTDIIKVIESLDYTVQTALTHQKNTAAKQTGITSLLGAAIVILALYLVMTNTVGFNFIPEVNHTMGYGLLFIIGLLTSLHCVAMCGGINVAQCVSYNAAKNDNRSKLTPSMLYNTGRVVSYTLIGGMAGALGSVISLSGTAKGLVAMIAGGFMMVIGLNMLHIFPQLRRLVPRMPAILRSNSHNRAGKSSPFYVGLLNGLMPCGPLQTMQLYALGTGSFADGALSLFMFSLGTIPLMFCLGAASSMLSSRFTGKMMKASAVLVIVLGVVMLNNGLSMSGINTFDVTSPATNKTMPTASTATVDSGIQYVTTKITSGRYTPITVQKGIPVKWTIQAAADSLNGCNNPIIIPKYNIERKLQAGDNTIEFTPDETGTIPYSCWMGMIRSKITVVDNISSN